ncbi:hypothetical protein MMC08_007027 [Hypocenomyce scalaris]|nr:hypothetical protein [Hypocenomyce scalaris]
MSGSSPSTPLSTPRSADESFPLPPGFGWEFEHCLEQKWQDHLEQQIGRLERYGRFGMDADDARRPTPEHLREAYRALVEEELADDHTPSPSPSPFKPTPILESSARLPISKPLQIDTQQTIHRSTSNGGLANASVLTAASNRKPGSFPETTSTKQDIVAHGKKKPKKSGKIAPTLAPGRIDKRQRKKVVRAVQHRQSTHRMETRARTLARRQG